VIWGDSFLDNVAAFFLHLGWRCLLSVLWVIYLGCGLRCLDQKDILCSYSNLSWDVTETYACLEWPGPLLYLQANRKKPST
jgi:hypothetical protein